MGQIVTKAFLPTLTSGFTVVNSLVHRNPITAKTTSVQPADGQVALDVTSFVRRTMTFSVPNLESLFQLLNVPGGEIATKAGIRYGTTTELVPAGVYRVDSAVMGYSASGNLQLTCPDRSVVIQRARLGADRASVATNTVWQEIKRLVEGAFTSTYAPFPGWALLDTTATDIVGAQIYDSGNRDQVIAQYLTDNALDFEFNAVGKAVLRPIPTSALTTWATVMGPGGVMIDASRTRGLGDTRNVIVLTTTRTDVQLQAVEVANLNDPAADQLSSLGPLGRQVMDYSGNFSTTAQMVAAGNALLPRYCAVQQQMTVTTVANASLDGWDGIAPVLPRSDLGSRPAESLLVQAITLPLTNKGQQQITGRAVIAA